MFRYPAQKNQWWVERKRAIGKRLLLFFGKKEMKLLTKLTSYIFLKFIYVTNKEVTVAVLETCTAVLFKLSLPPQFILFHPLLSWASRHIFMNYLSKSWARASLVIIINNSCPYNTACICELQPDSQRWRHRRNSGKRNKKLQYFFQFKQFSHFSNKIGANFIQTNSKISFCNDILKKKKFQFWDFVINFWFILKQNFFSMKIA